MKEESIQRIDYLDAVRGLAAYAVLVYHVIFSRWGDVMPGKIGALFFNGAAAVTMFFVLSGFVLSYKYFKNNTTITPENYLSFAKSRLFRLYPAFLFMLVIYYARAHWHELSFDFWVETIVKNPHKFWEEAALMRGVHEYFLPDWTLGVEMAISIFVPFLVIIARHHIKLLVYFMGAVFIASKHYIDANFIAFGIGILIAWNFEKILVFQDKTRWWYRFRWWLFPFVFLIYSLYFILERISPPGITYKYFTQNFLIFDGLIISAIGAGLILVYVINSNTLKRILSTPPLLFLGKISYGLYLSHWLFIGLFNSKGDEILAYFNQSQVKYFCALTAFATIMSCLMGIFLYYCIERPFIRLGKRI